MRWHRAYDLNDAHPRTLDPQVERPRGEAERIRSQDRTRLARRSYLYDAPQFSPRRVRRQTGIAMIAAAAVMAILTCWGVLLIAHWMAEALGSGLAPRVNAGALRSVMMTLPIA